MPDFLPSGSDKKEAIQGVFGPLDAGLHSVVITTLK
jgi:hypothetical protein